MTYKAAIELPYTAALASSLKPEMGPKLRSIVRASRAGQKLRIGIEAADAVALRASFNNVVQLLLVFEKINKIVGK